MRVQAGEPLQESPPHSHGRQGQAFRQRPWSAQYRVPDGQQCVPSLQVWPAEHVKGQYRFEILSGVGHFSTDQAPAEVTRLLLEHLATYRR